MQISISYLRGKIIFGNYASEIKTVIIQNKAEIGLEILHGPHTKTLSVVRVKFKFNWMRCIFVCESCHPELKGRKACSFAPCGVPGSRRTGAP